MFEKSPLQQCIRAITTMVLVGVTLWMTLLIQAAFIIRDTLTEAIIVHVGPFDLAQIQRLDKNGTEVIQMKLEPDILSYFICWIGLGLAYYALLWLFQKNVFK